jgi:glucose-6-phosphate isomerase
VAEVHQVLDRMSVFADAIRSGRWLGHTGRPILNVVNVGIGGSDLGPAMAYNALRPYSRAGMTFRFVSNVDGADLESALLGLDPAETLFIVCSKSWHTKETLTNATAARRWLLAGLSGDVKAVARHFVAVSTDERGVSKFGIDTANMFPIWDWVGGRYSVDSAIGLSLMIAIGPDQFREFLAGFRAIDEHFLSAHPRENLPMLMGLLGVWYSRFLGIDTVAVLPYAHYLSLLPAYLQQLEMESNGKRVTLEGGPVVGGTGSIIWGQAGTNGQHAFYQLLHQGTRTVPAEFIGFARPMSGLTDQHDLLMSNLIAQSEALAFGRDEAVLAAAGVAAREIPHRVCPGNRPSTVLLLRGLTPYGLGQLIALYEHRVFTEGVIYGIDSFDQWGVELGKQLAKTIVPELEASSEPELAHDASTNALIRRYRALKRRG